MVKGNPITLGGPEIKPGSDAPDFTALDNGLQPVKLSQAKGKVIVLSAVPSLDTPVGDTETRKFNQEAGKLGANVEVWTVSMDRSFAQNYGVLVKAGPLAGLSARAVFVVGKDGKVKHAEYVREITTEPNYDAALSAAKQAAGG
jgi:thiol peroxidase